jgi:hypothetical protein
MQEVRDELDARPEAYADGRGTIISIVEAADEICASLNAGPEPTVTGTPPTETPETTGTGIPEATSAIATLVAQTTITPTPAP